MQKSAMPSTTCSSVGPLGNKTLAQQAALFLCNSWPTAGVGCVGELDNSTFCASKLQFKHFISGVLSAPADAQLNTGGVAYGYSCCARQNNSCRQWGEPCQKGLVDCSDMPWCVVCKQGS